MGGKTNDVDFRRTLFEVYVAEEGLDYDIDTEISTEAALALLGLLTVARNRLERVLSAEDVDGGDEQDA